MSKMILNKKQTGWAEDDRRNEATGSAAQKEDMAPHEAVLGIVSFSAAGDCADLYFQLRAHVRYPDRVQKLQAGAGHLGQPFRK